MKFKSIWHQLKVVLPTLLIVYIPTVCALATLGFVSHLTKLSIGNFMSDPLTVMNGPFYIGLFSNIGILFWTSAAAICFFTAAILQKNYKTVKFASFLLASGFITFVLLLDDFFILHESAFPDYLHISQVIVLAIYAMMILFYIYSFRKEILKTEYVVLLMCVLFFGFSLMLDQTDYLHSPKGKLLEDGTKLLGIVSWFIYFTRVCMKAVESVTH